jgi:hypothetical protein
MEPLKIVVEIPAERHVKSYLERYFGKEILFPEREPFGSIFKFLLEKADDKKNRKVKTYEHSIRVRITEDVLFKNGHTMSPTNVRMFNNLVSRIIKNEALACLEVLRRGAKMKPKKSLDLYLETFDMPMEAMTLDMLKKSTQRLDEARLSPNSSLISTRLKNIGRSDQTRK